MLWKCKAFKIRIVKKKYYKNENCLTLTSSVVVTYASET